MPSVATISVTPVKGFRLLHPDAVELTEHGAVENRRFLLVDGEYRRLRSSLTAWPVVVDGEYDAATERLRMRFPDGTEVEGSALGNGAVVVVDYHRRVVAGRVVPGGWEAPLSALAGHPVRLVRPDRLGQVLEDPVTLVSSASVARLAEEAGQEVDPRRFRMLFDLDGCEPHEEDGWAGRRFAVGDAVLRVGGPVGRCAVTTRDPDTGERDLDTLRLIMAYRGQVGGGEIPFGVYARVEQPGRVRVGDALEPL
jgi:uncharacterized protein YcbX